jgi:glucose-6-phosphate 1-dehydrogenase
MRGDATLFTRNDEVEAQWRIIDPLVRAWRDSADGVGTYASGSQGPAEAASLLEGEDAWRSI